MNGIDKMQCAIHGSAFESYICDHLYDNAAQHWYSREPTADNPWPDAWCGLCDVEFLKAGEWNDQNSSITQIKLICSGCYERRRAQELPHGSNER
ncbi:hypothetical protein [Nevskia sp.]|uniref:hypothetical protein n=1 Tax=Nevskia sp. TaxID=1929292 RepID=UPI0025D0CD50|nr:hypothetical protein [Nevskia sp.]